MLSNLLTTFVTLFVITALGHLVTKRVLETLAVGARRLPG